MSSKYICSTRFESNYNNCTGKSPGKITGENICRDSSGGAQEKRKRMKLSLSPKLMVF
jgi:hypothetical protein